MSADREKELMKIAALYGVAPEDIGGAPGWLSDCPRPGGHGPFVQLVTNPVAGPPWIAACDRDPWEVVEEVEAAYDEDFHAESRAVIDLDGWEVLSSQGTRGNLGLEWGWSPLPDVGDDGREA